MSLYQCEECGCIENTALGEVWDWDDTDVAGHPKKQNLCSECGGEGWHGRFKRRYLPMGLFVKNRDGNLQHRETGEPPDSFEREEPWSETS
jgi:hypothetical protein